MLIFLVKFQNELALRYSAIKRSSSKWKYENVFKNNFIVGLRSAATKRLKITYCFSVALFGINVYSIQNNTIPFPFLRIAMVRTGGFII